MKPPLSLCVPQLCGKRREGKLALGKNKKNGTGREKEKNCVRRKNLLRINNRKGQLPKKEGDPLREKNWGRVDSS